MKAIVEYIVFDFKNAVNNDYKNQTTFISSKLKNVELKRKDEQLIKNVLKIVFFENEYVSNLSIRSIPLSDRKITASFKESLMNAFNTFTPPSRIARFILLKSAQFAVRFFNLSSQSVSKITEKQTKKALHKKLKSFLAKEKILSSRKTAVDDYSRIIEEILQSKQSFKTFSSSFFFLSSAAIKLHIDVKKKMKRAFDATVKFVFEESKRNVSICTCEKVNSMILWKLDERKCKINELFTILKKFKQIQKNEKKKNVYRSHWRLLTWKLELILMNERGAELFKARLLIKLYQCSDHDKEFDDLKTNASTKI